MKALLFFVSVYSAYAVVQDFKIGIRLIPADVLRDFRTSCFASTQCKLFAPNETWSLLPHCGYSRCVNQTGTGRLLEEVVDCGPVINIKDFPTCHLIPDSFNKSDVFPNCCPKYECEGDETSVIYPDEKPDKPKTEAPVQITEKPVLLDYAQYEDPTSNQDPVNAQYQDIDNSQYQDPVDTQYQDPANAQYQDPENVQYVEYEDAQNTQSEEPQYIEDSA